MAKSHKFTLYGKYSRAWDSVDAENLMTVHKL